MLMDNLLIFNHSVVCFSLTLILLNTVFMDLFEEKRSVSSTKIIGAMLKALKISFIYSRKSRGSKMDLEEHHMLCYLFSNLYIFSF